jgi:hypothetical protein
MPKRRSLNHHRTRPAHGNGTIDGQDLYGVNKALFPRAMGSTLAADIQSASLTQVLVTVPLGAVDGSVNMTLQPVPGVTTTSNSLAFARLPNVRIRANTKDLSSGESVQFAYTTLGASSPSAMTWTADVGHVSASGLYRAFTAVSGSSIGRSVVSGGSG